MVVFVMISNRPISAGVLMAVFALNVCLNEVIVSVNLLHWHGSL